MLGDLNGARVIPQEDMPAIALNVEVLAVVGATQEELLRPEGARMLALKVESGTFRIKPGQDTNPLAAPTATDLTVGGQSVALTPTDGIVVLSAPQILTVVGSAGGDILTFWWLPG